jgi:glycosyltransferase involved in cell wall biosynthesis
MSDWLHDQAASGSLRLLHMHGLWMMPSVYPGQVARKYGIPLVAAPRGTLSTYAFRSGSLAKRVFWPFKQKPALEAATCFQATAEAEYQDIRRMGFRQPVAIIPNAVDLPAVMQKPKSEERTLLYLGRLHPEKGVETILRAWKEVFSSFPEWRLRIVGPDVGGYGSRLKAMSREWGLQRVDFTGPLYGNDKLQAYQAADLYILMSPSENFGVSVAEALASAIPAIVSKGAPWRGLSDRNAGWWVSNEAGSVVASLRDALGRPVEGLRAMGLNGRRWMQEEYSWASVAQKTLEAYRWILHGGPRPDCIAEG